jgi:flagellar protein FliJ
MTTKEPTMTSLQPLLALLHQAEHERDDALAASLGAADALAKATAQAEQLLDYRREYEQRWSAQFRAGGRIELVHCYRGFMDRLSQAVDQQQRIAEQAAAQVERTRVTLAEQELRVASVRKLIERRHHEQRLGAERIEQKQTDEFGARMAWSQPGPFGAGVPKAA